MKKITKFFQTKATSIDEANKTVTFAISNDSVDRMGEVVDQKSWDFKDYQNNPQFLWGHDPSVPENVLGQCTDLQVSKDGGETLGTFQFDTDINPRADMVFKQIKRGSLRTVSVGFISDTVEYVKSVPHLVGNKLLEVSVVPIPANATALAKDFHAGVISRKDLKWLKESAESELEFIDKELAKQTNDEDGLFMEEQLKQLATQNSALLDAITMLTKAQAEQAKSQTETDKRINALITKGPVADILAVNGKWDLQDDKWDLIAPVSCMFQAFVEAYCYTGTPVDQFEPLLKEFVGLVSQVLDGSYNGKSDGRLGEATSLIDDARVKDLLMQILDTDKEKQLITKLLPLADESEAWDGPAAVKAVKAWASDDDGNIDFAKYGKAFFSKSGDGDKQGDFKLPFATVEDGKLKAVWNGVAAAYEAVKGARGGTDDIDEDAVLTKIKSYYKKFDKDWPEKALDLADEHTKDGEATVTKDGAADPAPIDPATDVNKTDIDTPTDEPVKGEETHTEDSANGGDNDQPGAEDGELDLDAELTPELEEQLVKAFTIA